MAHSDSSPPPPSASGPPARARDEVSVPPGKQPKRDSVRRLVRGSTLLLFGRLLSKLSNFVIQVLIVRYLSQSAFGGFAYALSVVTLAQAVMILGLDRSIVRFLPIYHEQRDHRKVIGTIVMSLVVILSLGLAAIAALHGFQGFFGRWIQGEQALSLLLVLIFLAPLQALDDLLIHLFAVFAKPRSIFFRRHVLAPALKITVVLALILSGSDVFFLAFGYIAATLAGVVIYGYLLIRLLGEQGLLADLSPRKLVMPWREVFTFTFPLLVSELALVTTPTASVVMLGHYWGTVGVAGLRAVQPTAKLNELVMASFATLFTPLAARLHSRQEGAAINDLYWRSAIWIAILSFPVFALTFSLAGPITALLFGSRYEDSAPILALLAFGYYFNAALGFNGLTLKVLGRVRYMLIISLVTAAIGLLSAFLLIPKLGPIGAGIASATTLVVHNLLKQAGLLGTGIGLFDWRYLRAYVVIAVSALGVLLIQIVLAPSTLAAIGLGVLAILAVMVLNVRALDVQQTFPEATKLPLSKLFVSRGRPQAESPPGGPPESVEQDRVRTT